MIGNFNKAYDRVRIYEGGNDDDPKDPGGRTSRGITQKVYDAYRRRKNLETKDVWRASEEEVREIYEVQYWDAVKGDRLPAGIDLFVYDSAVNSGPIQAIKWLQRAIGTDADGYIGQATWAAIEAKQDHDLVIANMSDQRLTFLRNLKHYNRFGRGWTRRVDNVTKAAQAWAIGTVGPMPEWVSAEDGHKKANARDADAPMVSQETGIATTTATSAGSAIVAQVQQTSEFLQSFTTVTYVKYALIALALVAFCITIYSIWKTRKVKEAVE